MHIHLLSTQAYHEPAGDRSESLYREPGFWTDPYDQGVLLLQLFPVAIDWRHSMFNDRILASAVDLTLGMHG